MVKTESKKQSPMTARLFLNSIKSWYPDGIHVCVGSVSKPIDTDRENRKSFAFNLQICEEMPKCRARVIGEGGKVVKIEDEMGDLKDKIETIKNPEEVTLWLNLTVENAENDEFKAFNIGSAFPLLNYAFIEAGDVPEDNKQNLIFTYDEMVEAVEGLEFKAHTESRSFKGGKPYQVLIPKSL